jgi:hypothetical protein
MIEPVRGAPSIPPSFPADDRKAIEAACTELKKPLDHFRTEVGKLFQDPTLLEDSGYLNEVQRSVLALSEKAEAAKQLLGGKGGA